MRILGGMLIGAGAWFVIGRLGDLFFNRVGLGPPDEDVDDAGPKSRMDVLDDADRHVQSFTRRYLWWGVAALVAGIALVIWDAVALPG